MHHISKEPSKKPKTDSKSSKSHNPKTVRFANDSKSETGQQKQNTINEN